MSDSDEPSSPLPRRVSLDVTLKRDPRPVATAAAAPWSRARSWVLGFFVVFCAASWYAWVELRGHPIANYVSVLPQLTAVFAAMTTLLGGGDPNFAKTWYQSRATTLLQWLDRHARGVCAVLAIGTCLVAYAGAAMREIEVQCPAGCQLRYGHLGAQTACDQHHDRIWMPLGLEEVVPTFECSMPGGHGEWQPLRRTVRDEAGSRDVFSCYEDGGRVTQYAFDATLAYVEYGWSDATPERSPAPCDHLPVGIYRYDPVANTCTWWMGLADLTAAMRDAVTRPDADPATRSALRRIIGSDCHDCPDAAATDQAIVEPEVDDAGVPSASAAVPRPAHGHSRSTGKPDVCPRPEDDPFALFPPEGCHGDYGNVVLELLVRQVAIGVGISYRGGNDRRCVPSEARRDGYVHLLLPDGELVLAVTDEPRPRVVLIEDVRATAPPPALATTCSD
jgi:hypothetical protein